MIVWSNVIIPLSPLSHPHPPTHARMHTHTHTYNLSHARTHRSLMSWKGSSLTLRCTIQRSSYKHASLLHTHTHTHTKHLHMHIYTHFPSFFPQLSLLPNSSLPGGLFLALSSFLTHSSKKISKFASLRSIKTFIWKNFLRS